MSKRRSVEDFRVRSVRSKTSHSSLAPLVDAQQNSVQQPQTSAQAQIQAQAQADNSAPTINQGVVREKKRSKMNLTLNILETSMNEDPKENTFNFEATMAELVSTKVDTKQLKKLIKSNKEWRKCEKSDLREFLEKKSKLGDKIDDTQLILVKTLGQGTYGSVAKVRHTKTDIDMAKKTVLWQSETNEKPEAKEKMRGVAIELKVLFSSLSPYVIGYYDAYMVSFNLCLLVEYMELGSFMSVLLKTNRVPEHVLARLAESVIKGLKYLKDTFGVVHRDIKPENVLLNKNGMIKISDFGISLYQSNSSDCRLGTSYYMAPERFNDYTESNYEIQADIWSLGVTLVHLAIGKYPFPKMDVPAIEELFRIDPNGYQPRVKPYDFEVLNMAYFLSEKSLPQEKEKPLVDLPVKFFSSNFCEFVKTCLALEPAMRKDYETLLKDDSFVTKKQKKRKYTEWVGKIAELVEQ